MQAPVVNTSLTALQDWTRRTAAVGWALAYLHERRASRASRASNADTGVFPSVAPPVKLRVSPSGSSLSAQKAANRLASLRVSRVTTHTSAANALTRADEVIE